MGMNETPPAWARSTAWCCDPSRPAYSSTSWFSYGDGCGKGMQASVPVVRQNAYVPKPPKYRGKVILNRRKPFELFLKFGGGIFDMHFQVHRLVIMFEGKRRPKSVHPD